MILFVLKTSPRRVWLLPVRAKFELPSTKCCRSLQGVWNDDNNAGRHDEIHAEPVASTNKKPRINKKLRGILTQKIIDALCHNITHIWVCLYTPTTSRGSSGAGILHRTAGWCRGALFGFPSPAHWNLQLLAAKTCTDQAKASADASKQCKVKAHG